MLAFGTFTVSLRLSTSLPNYVCPYGWCQGSAHHISDLTMSRDNLRPSLVYTGNVEQYMALEQSIDVSTLLR
jgi:hypothetical protein